MTNSYGQILRSSSIIGGAQAINYIVALLRVKVVAVLLGPAGVGLIGLYISATSLLGALTGLGLQGSSVRAIVQAQGKADPLAVGRTIRTLRRLVWVTGALGWLASIALALPLSRWMFQSTEHAWALAILGGMLMLTAVSNGQLGLLQGLRRIGDIARVQVAAAILNTAVTLGLYAWLREDGIVPVLLANAAITLLCSWWFARRVEVPTVAMDWPHAIAEAKPLLGLGVTMMWGGVLTLVLDLYVRTLITRTLGVDAAGIYQAAWALSGLFAGFVLGAMGTDFYPRLTVVIHDRAAAIRAVNEQTEIGILLALPGLLVTLAFAKWVVWALYSSKFASAADVLVWMVLGVFGRVLSWPMGFIQLSMGAGRWVMATEATFLAIQAVLATWLVPTQGVVGAAYAFALSYLLYTAGMAWVGRRLIGYRWSAAVLRMMLISGALMCMALAANRLLSDIPAMALGALLAMVGGLWSMRELVSRLGVEHRVVRWIRRVPGMRKLVGA
ncbi:O-antigen translocase [Luteimonas sp. A537]